MKDAHMKENFNTKSALFTECKNSIPSSRYLRLSTARYGKICPFSVYFQYKNNAQNESKSQIFSPQMAFKYVW